MSFQRVFAVACLGVACSGTTQGESGGQGGALASKGGANSNGGASANGGASSARGGSVTSQGGALSTQGGTASGGSGVGGSAGVSSGGTSAGGSSAGGTTAGGSSAGGTSAGGSSAGGTSAAGSSSGGASRGGATSGGSSNGGSSSGGAVSGGAASGGAQNRGGAASGGASGGSSASGGATASGGSTPSTDPCLGWASVNAEGLARTTGGEGGPVVQITTAEQLASYRRDPAPMILRIMNNLNGEFELGSNKTVEGANSNITINGSLSFSGTTTATLSNLIVRNLRINAVTSTEDGMDIRYAHHACVHHCEFIDGPDGNLDIVSEANYVTVAYNKFRYTSAWHALPGETSANHRFSNLVGSSNTTQLDRGKLKVTFHHNWWAEGVVERMPRVRFGDVHVFNNYYSSTGNDYCIAGGIEARLVIENNFFENVANPHEFYDGDTTAQIKASGNEYVNVTGLKDSGQGASFTPPYAYTLEAGTAVKASVMANAGPR
ncbi:MAG: hypothetical protein QM756_02685 [Polyangiaceae bacterium]